MLQRKFCFGLVIISLFFGSIPVDAVDIAGHDLVLPIVARAPGAFGSEWRTDVIVTNISRRMNPVAVTITFHPTGQTPLSVNHLLHARESVSLRDTVRETFNFDRATGLIRIKSSSSSAKLTARARIYNVGGSHGEFGQTSQALPIGLLGTEAYLSGLSGVGSNRTNIGIANPHAEEANIFISLFEKDGELRGGYSTSIPPSSVTQINDIFGQFPAGPLHDATIVITSSTAVYAYGSVVRSDSGDADFVIGISGSTEGSDVVTPDCSAPAPLLFGLAGYEAEGWIVVFHPGTNAAQVAAELSARLGFTITSLYEELPGFLAEMTPETIAALRCEPSVSYVQQNQLIP
jgi:hypothetical protein